MRFLAVAVLVFAFLFGVLYVERLVNKSVYKVGSILTPDATEIVTLVNSVDTVTADRYDSYQSPRGTDYVAPAATTLYIGYLIGAPDVAGAASVHVRIGYGDDAVSDSVAAPTNAVIVWDVSYENPANLLNPRSVWIPIPAGKYPFLQLTPGGNVQAVGIEQ